MTPTFGDRWRQLTAAFRRPRREEPTMTDTPDDVDEVQVDGPIEPPGGQDDDPPDLGLALLVAIVLLRDIRSQLQHDHDDDDTESAELLLRITALLSVLRRIRKRLDRGEDV